MINSTKVAKRYAKALLDFAIEKKQEEELFQEVSMRYPATIKIGDRKSVPVFQTNLTNQIK